MWGILATYVRVVDRVNRRVGRITMYGLFALLGVLLYSSFMKTFFIPPLWTLEMSQFLMVGYFILGGAYSLQIQAHVRMDLLYGAWSPRKKAAVDAVTVLFLLFYLVMLLVGGFSSTGYALEYGERAYGAWRPYMAPIKIVMCIGIGLMLLQAVAILIRDIAYLRGVEMPRTLPPGEAET